MSNKRRNLGFTLAEMLIVVAIIGVLAGVSFVAVQAHQRSLTQLERDSIAKEIFVAAQNHLAMAKSENYLETSQTSVAFGTPGNAEADADNDDIYYLYSRDSVDSDSINALALMLPFGSIDETVRAGHYIIRYQPKAAVVLDVFYWDTDRRFGCDLDGDDYANLMKDYRGDDHKKYRPGVLGWFGDQEVVNPGDFLKTPSIEVVNGERLYVNVTDANTDNENASLKLIITGESSGAMAAIPLSMLSSSGRVTYDPATYTYTVMLDDITAKGMHFAQLGDETDFQFLQDDGVNIPFIPGENITVQAVGYSNDSLTSVAYSGEWTTNSLFAEISQKSLDGLYADLTNDAAKMENPSADDPWITAKIGGIRHLENLNAAISRLGDNDDDGKLAIANAMQTADLDWTGGFLAEFGEDVTILDAENNAAAAGCFVPVVPSRVSGDSIAPTALNYDGKGIEATTTDEGTTYTAVTHSVKGLKVDNSTGDIEIANGGMFGSVGATETASSIANLELIDFSISLTSGDAGALVGTLTNCAVTNVLAHNSTAATDVNITAPGSVGGLVGSMEDSTVSKSAAALIVSSTEGDAGGLIGKSSGGTVDASYSAGHGIEKKNNDDSIAVVYDAANYNITAAAGKAGGLIGDAGNTQISHSYSTCSVTGKTAGGFVGDSSGAISSCYTTGLVNITTDANGNPVLVADATSGAFAGSYSGTATDCHYFEIINEWFDEAIGCDYLTAIAITGEGDDGTYPNITALDSDADAYNAFSGPQTVEEGAEGGWAEASPYSEALKKYYWKNGKDDEGNDITIPLYDLKTVEQLIKLEDASKALADDENDTTPYFVSTHYGDWPAPEIFVLNTPTTGNP